MATQTDNNSTYIWFGKDRQGNKARGELPGASVALIRAQLRKQGITPTRVRKKTGSVLGKRKKKIKPGDISIFSRQLATMMKAGIPLVQSFDIVADSLDNPSMSAMVREIRDDVAQGTQLTDAIRKHPRYFDDLYCNLVSSGEQSGSLEVMLDRIATYKEKTESLKAKIRKALKYPIAVIAVAIIVTGLLLVKVVPQFAETFSSFGAELPAFTLLVLGMSDVAIAHWWKVVIGLGVLYILFREGRKRSRTFSDRVDAMMLKIPIIGPIVEKSCYARFARTMSTTFSAGVPLVEALDSVAGATGNAVYEYATQRIRDDVTTGQQLQFAIRNTTLFPAMIVQMVGIGEESGELDTMLDKCASYYEEEVDNAVDGLTSLIEPVIISILGILVGGLLVAMYLPIFQLGAVM